MLEYEVRNITHREALKKNIEKATSSDAFIESQEKDLVEKGTRLTLIDTKNRKLRKDNKSGVTGVRWDEKNEKWVAHLKYKRKNRLQKSFDNKEEAISARKKAEEEYFKPILEKYNGSKGVDE